MNKMPEKTSALNMLTAQEVCVSLVCMHVSVCSDGSAAVAGILSHCPTQHRSNQIRKGN